MGVFGTDSMRTIGGIVLFLNAISDSMHEKDSSREFCEVELMSDDFIRFFKILIVHLVVFIPCVCGIASLVTSSLLGESLFVRGRSCCTVAPSSG